MRISDHARVSSSILDMGIFAQLMRFKVNFGKSYWSSMFFIYFKFAMW